MYKGFGFCLMIIVAVAFSSPCFAGFFDGPPSKRTIFSGVLIIKEVCGSPRNCRRTYTYNFKEVKTHGNRSYIPLDMDGRVEDYVDVILDLLEQFEKQKNLKVKNWVVERDQEAYRSRPKIYGIWITH